jgi:hypothetical protein
MHNHVLYTIVKCLNSKISNPIEYSFTTLAVERQAIRFSKWAERSECIMSFAFWLGADAPGLEW